MATRLSLSVFWLLCLCHVVFGQNVISISANSGDIYEDDGNVTLTVTRSGDVSNNLVIDVTYTGVAEQGVDFYGPITVTFSPEVTGPINMDFNLEIIDDMRTEQNETLTVTLTPRDNSIFADSIDLTLKHSDPATISVNTLSVDENNGVAAIELSCDLPDDTNQVVFDATFFPSTAVAGTNFRDDQGNSGLVCAKPSQTVSADVTIMEDGKITEDLKMFLLISETDDNINGGLGFTIPIINKDPITVTFENLNGQYTEGDAPVTFTPTFSFGSTDPFNFDLDIAVVGEGATPGVDFTHNMPTSARHVVGPDASFVLTIIDDQIHEGPEHFKVQMTSAYPMVAEFTVTIQDNDADSVTCNTEVTVDEDAGIAGVECERQGTEGELEVTITPFQGTGDAAPRTDFAEDPVTITFGDGVSIMVANISITGNEIQDGPKHFAFNVTTTDATANIVTQFGTVTMTDNDFDFLTITSESSYGEDVGTVTVIVTRGNTSEAIDVQAQAKVPEDPVPYPITSDDIVETTITLNFAMGSDTAQFEFQIVDDEHIEPNETILLSFFPPYPMLIVDKYITITNNDPYRLSLPHFLACDENQGNKTITIHRDLAEEELTVEVTTSDITATAGEDYSALNKFDVTFPAGVMTTTFDIPILDDDMHEEDETLSLQFVGPNVSPLDALLAIVDNEGVRPFDCRRLGQDCFNVSDVCHYEAPFCECVGETPREGDDCAILTDEIGGGTCGDQCGQYGTCVFDTAPRCICHPGYYGETCQEKIFQLICTIDGMTVFANPHGNFQGWIYPTGLQANTTCHLGPLPPPTAADDIPDQLRGLYKHYAHTNDCGTLTPVEKGNVTSYIRVFYVQYDVGIETGLDQVLTMECQFNKMNITVGHFIFEITDTNNRPSGGSSTTFIPFQMQVMIDNQPISTASTATVVEINKEICLNFNISTAYGGLELLDITFNDTLGTSRWTVYNRGCVNQTSQVLSREPYYPQAGSKRRQSFCFKAFKFITGNKLGALFRIRICLSANDCFIRTCIVSSTTRRRRQVANIEETDQGAVFTVYDPSYQTVHQDQSGNPVIVDNNVPDVAPISRPSIMPILVGLGVGMSVLALVTACLCYAMCRMKKPKKKSMLKG